jgi:dephospho-CoA kinase
MISIGITGIIGSGKSKVSKILEILDCPVYYADIEAKKLMIDNNEIKFNLIREFGADTYINGIPNKELISKLVFGNNQNREKVNSIIHPIVIDDFKNWIKLNSSTTKTMVAIESALLYYAKIDKITDYIIEVICSEHIAVQRIKFRDNISEAEAINKIRIQKNQIPKNANPDFIIENNDFGFNSVTMPRDNVKINHQQKNGKTW